jgi:uncharacterized repeat protein (TIGR03803 family)
MIRNQRRGVERARLERTGTLYALTLHAFRKAGQIPNLSLRDPLRESLNRFARHFNLLQNAPQPFVSMRNTWSLLMGLLILVAPAAQAQFNYTTNSGAITITGYTGSGGAVTIPSSINGLPVTGIAAYAISDLFSTPVTVTIPGSVTSIGDYAFQFNYSLPRVFFEGNAPNVGPNVFFGDTLFGGTQTAYYLAGTTGWGSTVGHGVPTKQLNGITISAIPTNGVEHLTVSFTSSDVDFGGNTITSWNWDFGDGSTSAAQNPSHTYPNNGAFSVALIGNSNGVPIAGAAASITVAPITVGITANPTTGAAPLVVNFTSGAIDSTGNTITNWNWSFGDGSTSTAQNPSHTYTNPGTFSLALISLNNLGYTVIGTGPASITVAPPTLAFTANPTNGVVPLTVSFTSPAVDSGGSAITSWNWDFGDGSTSTAQNPSHTYTNPGAFSVGLVVTNNIGFTITCSGPASVTVAPLTVAFSANPTGGLEPLTVNFTSPGFDNGSNTITSWNWNFGDGSTSTAQNPSHTYTSPGTFSVGLVVTNNIGFTITGSGPASITVAPLTVAYAANPTTGAFPLTVNFSSAGVDNGSNTITSWNWNFGDGATSALQNPSHTYTNAAIYAVALTATNNIGLAVIGLGPASVRVFLPVPPYNNFTVLHTFTGNDGAYPYAGLILSGNTLYGTTEHSISPPNGTVFGLNNATLGFGDLLHFSVFNPPGVENYDGANPEARLILSGNILYGTALLGGQDGYGNVFSLTTGTPRLIALHVFNGATVNSGGTHPAAALVLAGNTLYGTTSSGGLNGYGTVFSLSTSGAGFTSLYNFTGGADGANPLGDLIISGNTLYGTANKGGSHGYGTVFSIGTSGSNFTSLYSFSGGADGAYPPAGGLLLWSNTLYGVANQGGSNGYGTVFSVSTNGSNFSRLYSFTGMGDGAYPGAGLVISGETLYGAASGGGPAGNGTIFSLGAQGSAFTMLYSFTATNTTYGTNSDGANPQPGLLLSGNLLYGTARHGGSHGYGTVFVLPVATQQPDLTKGADSLSSVTPHAGDTVTASVTVTNQSCPGGSANAGAFHVGFYGLSTTSAGLNTLTPFYEEPVSGCPSNSTVSFKLNIIIPTTTPGTYYLGYKINDEHEVAECNENNNGILYWTLNVLPSPPSKATSPDPANGAPGQPINSSLSWANGGGATSYDVYFNGQFKGNQTAATYNPATLAYNTTYPWRIDAKNSGGTTTGDSWSFTTVAPKLGAAQQGSSLILLWPTNAVGFMLQYATNLPSTNWQTVVPSPVIVNGQYTVTNTTSGMAKFFRLLW